MNHLFTRAIASVVSFLKSLRAKQALIAVFAGVLLLVTTACGSNTYATNPRSVDLSRDKFGADEVPPNNPDRHQAETSAKARQLIERAENRLDNKRAGTPGEVGDNIRNYNPLGEQARDFSRKVGETGEEIQENFTEGTRQGIRNVQESAENVSRDVPRAVNQAKQNAQGVARDAREGAEDFSEGLQTAAEQASEAAQNRINDAANSVRNRS